MSLRVKSPSLLYLATCSGVKVSADCTAINRVTRLLNSDMPEPRCLYQCTRAHNLLLKAFQLWKCTATAEFVQLGLLGGAPAGVPSSTPV